MAATIVNGTKAASLHSHRLEGKVAFATSSSSFLLSPFARPYTSLAEAHVRTTTLAKGHQTWAGRFTENQLTGFVAQHRARLTQSLSRLVEAVALRFSITHSLLMILKQRGEVSIGGAVISTASYQSLFPLVKAEYPLVNLYNSLNQFLNANLSQERPVLPFSTVTDALGFPDAEAVTQDILLDRIRDLTIYLPSARDAAFQPVETAVLHDAILDGSLSGKEYAKYLLTAGYAKSDILASLRNMRDVALAGADWKSVADELNFEQAAELVEQLSA